MGITQSVQDFMVAGDVSTDRRNIRQAGLYAGLILEETSEMLRRILGDCRVVRDIEAAAADFKVGLFDEKIAAADPVGLLDDCCDITWVAIGAGFSMGADMHGALAEVAASNMSKVDPDTGKMKKHPVTGKIMKGDAYRPPRLNDFVSTQNELPGVE